MDSGAVALVLHAHLPYVRAAEPDSLEEDWFFQALIECYLPLLEMLETAAGDPEQQPQLTMGISPTLLSLLADPTLQARFPAGSGHAFACWPKRLQTAVRPQTISRPRSNDTSPAGRHARAI